MTLITCNPTEKLRRFIGPVLLLLTIHAYSQAQTPPTHNQNPQGSTKQKQSTEGRRTSFSSQDFQLSGGSRSLETSADNRPLQPFEMQAQLLTGTDAKAVKAVILSGINLQITTTPSTCGLNNGTIVIQASGGTAPYQYQLDGGSWSYSSIFFTGSSTTHTITVKDATGQTGTTTVTLANTYNTPVVSVASSVPASGCTTADGGITLQASGGMPPYSYSIDGQNWQTSPVFTGLEQGWYYFYIKDANSCVNSVYFQTPSCFAYHITATYRECQTNGIFTGTMDPSTPNPPFSYSMDGGGYQSTFDFTGLGPGKHVVRIKDNLGTLYDFEWYIAHFCNLALKAVTQDASCTGDGSVTATASNGTPPYLYSIDGINYQSSNLFTGLLPGNYTVVVQDALHTLQGLPVIVYSGCITGAAVPKPATCGNNDGGIRATATGGTPPYSYTLTGGATNITNTTGIFTGLAPGGYNLRFTDSRGIYNDLPLTIDATPCFSVILTPTPATCANSDGQISVTVGGGTAPYSYSLVGPNTNIQGASPPFTGLAAGSYTVTVTDFHNLTASSTVTVGLLCPELTVTGTDASCGKSDGQIVASVSNGTPPYTFSLDGGSFQSNPIFPGLAPGPHTVQAKDATPQLSNIATVTLANVCISVSLTPKDENCDQQNGAITVAASGGTAPYQYSVNGVDFQTTNPIGSLKAGTYTVTAMDSRGFKGTQNVGLGNTPAPQIGVATTAASCSNDDGTIQITGTGGVAPYQYTIDGNNFVSSGSWNQRASGTYPTAVRDAAGCVTSQPAVVALNNTLTVSAGPDPTICEGTSVVLPAASNGISFSWQPSTGLDNPSLMQPSAAPRTTTIYTLTAADGACQRTGSLSVIVNPAPTPDPGKNSTVCYGASTQLHAGNGTSWVWSPATYLSDPTARDPQVEQPERTTTYSLSVTDANGCQSLHPAPVTVTVSPPAQLSAGADTSVVTGQPLRLNAVDVNGTGFTTFTWSPSDGLSDPYIQEPVATLSVGVSAYTVRAVSDAGCAAVASITIKAYGFADIFVPSGFSPNADGHNDFLRPIPVGIREFKYFAVFSRWGQRVFFSQDPNIGWSGTVDGQTQSPGTYVWMAAGIDYSGKLIQRKGTVTLIR